LLSALHLSEQYLTSAQFLAQALRQVMSRPHCVHGLLGRDDLLPLNAVLTMLKKTMQKLRRSFAD
jgi:hypothetical protein